MVGKGSIYADETENMLYIDSSKVVLTQDLLVQGDASINNILEVSNNLLVKGDASINNILEVSNHLLVLGDASINNVLEISNNLILHGQLHGPSSFIIDPATIGNNTGKVQIKGDLEVLGNHTTIHSTIVDICDNRIRLNGVNNIVDAGIDISINNTTKSFIYESNENTWKIDDASLNIEGNLIVNNVQYAHVPAGAVVSFAMAVAPNGWLICDGATVSRTTYANLFNAIGVLYGTGDGSNTFHLPDLKDRFVRSKSNTTNVGFTRSDSTAKPDGLVITTASNGDHQHDIELSYSHSGGARLKNTSVNNTSHIDGVIHTNPAGAHTHTVNTSGWDSETAPKHIVLLYCIKF